MALAQLPELNVETELHKQREEKTHLQTLNWRGVFEF